MNFDNGYSSLASTTIGYRLEGDGPFAVVLLHGLNSHSGTWRKTIPELSGLCRVLAPSLPVHRGGVSESLAASYADIVQALMDELGMRRAVLVGSSMGGWTAMRVAASRPGLASALLLEDTAGARSLESESLARGSEPVSIVWGEDDRTIPLSEGRLLHSRIERSELHVVRGAEHVPHWERPSDFNSLLVEFVRRGF